MATQERPLDRGEQEPKPDRPLATRAQVMAAVLGGALALGVTLRVAYFFAGRSLWIDEARLALNVATRSYPDLLRSLDYDQTAPPLFLWAEKLMTQLLGIHEQAFWVVPLVCGIGAMLLFLPLARRFLPGWPGVLAAASACVAPTLMHFSAVAKPYMGDLTVALAVMVATCAWIDRAESRWGRALPWIGAVAVWISTPAIFTLVPAGAALIIGAPRERQGQAMSIAALWGASFLAAYGLVYRSTSQSEYLHEFWRYAFLQPWRPEFLSRMAYVRREVLTALTVGLHDPATSGPLIPDLVLQGQRLGTWLVALVGVIGAIAWARRRATWEWVVLLGPGALLIAAAGMGVYPASSRLAMFLAPAVTISVTAGTVLTLQRLAGRARRVATGAVVTMVFAAQLLMSVRYLVRSPTIENLREMVAVLDQSRDVPQIVYVHAGALPAWAFYTTDWTHPDGARLARYAAIGASDGAAFENAASRGRVAPGEGWQLRFTNGRRLELIGIPAGVWQRPKVPNAGRVDVGWVTNEVDRIKRAAGCQGGAWVLIAHADRQDNRLLQGLSDAGGRVGFRMTGLVASLTRFEFWRPVEPCRS